MTVANRTTARTLGSAALSAAGASLMLTISPTPAAAVPSTEALAKPPVASSTIRCEAASSGKQAGKYAGLSASYAYDKRFAAGPTFEQAELDDHTPQGVVWWEDWKDDQSGEDLLLVSAYGQGAAHVIGLDPATGRTVGTVSITPRFGDTAQTHAGAIGLNDEWLFVDGPKIKPWHTIRKYSLVSLRAAMAARDGAIIPTVRDRKVYGASFLTVAGNHLYAGKFNKDGRDWMYRYTIAGDGSLKLDRQPDGDGLRWEVPRSTQGVVKAGNRFIFSSSSGRDNRSNLYVTDATQTTWTRPPCAASGPRA